MICIAVFLVLYGSGTAGDLTHETPKGFYWSWHVGSAHPISDLDSLADANIHASIDLGYKMTDIMKLGAVAGLNQFTEETATGMDNRRWINTSLQVQVFTGSSTGLIHYLAAGAGYYYPKSGSNEVGWHAGIGNQIPLSSGPFKIEFGLDYHQIQTDPATRFLVFRLGVIFK